MSIFEYPHWRILHIDDDEEDHFIVRMMLKEAQGRTVRLDWAATLDEGRQKLRSDHYQAVLVDYDLGTGSGIDLIREFVDQGHLSPLILLTGRGSYEVDMEAMRAGASLYLVKNEISPLLLERSIRYAIERKQAEQALLQRDRMLSAALAVAQLGAWTYSFADGMFEMDQRAQEMYRANHARQRLDSLVQKHMHPDDIDGMWKRLELAADPNGAGSFYMEYRILQPDGEDCWLKVWGTVEFEGQGKERHASRLIGASRDITLEKLSEAIQERNELELRQVNDLLEGILEGTEGMIAAMDSDFCYTAMNESYREEFEQVFGRELEIGDCLIDILAELPEERQKAVEMWKRALEGETFTIIEEFGDPRLDRKVYEKRFGPIFNPEGIIIGAAEMATDVTERVKVEESMRESQHRYRELVEDLLVERSKLAAAIDRVPVGIGIGDGKGNTLSLNRAGLDLHGFASEADMFARLDQYIEEFELLYLDGRSMPVEEWPLSRALRGDYVQEYELCLRNRATGKERILSYSVVPVHNSAGERMLIVYMMQDLTERINTENELRRSNEDLEQFAFFASHDMREPLRKISQFGKNLREHMDGIISAEVREKAEDSLRRMLEASERMQAMIDGLLDLSRLNAQAVSFERVDLGQVVEQVLSDLDADIQAKGAIVSLDTLPEVRGDALQLRQLFQNLIENGLKFHKPGEPARVHICSREDPSAQNTGRWAAVVVADEGVGFDEQFLDRILQPFQRLHGRNEFEGTGIGLAICKRIVERHKGKIEAESKPGKGAKFIVTLPVR